MASEQRRALDAHEALYKTFIFNRGESEKYPENYGGDYIEEGKLHVCIVNIKESDISEYTKILHDYLDVVVFEEVRYSLQSLLTASESVAKELISDGVAVYSCAVSEVSNSLVVSTNISELNKKGIYVDIAHKKTLPKSKFLPEEIIVYEASNKLFEVPVLFENGVRGQETTQLMGGTPLEICTLGVCGTYGGQNAIAICGHNMWVGKSIRLLSDNSQVGTVNVQRYGDGLSGDYSIVKITGTGFTTSNKVGDPSNSSSQTSITSSVGRAATGTAVIKYGKNAGYAYGTVTSSNITWYPSGITDGIYGLVDLRLAIGSNVPGDSGGPCYTADGVFCGTVTGTNGTDSYGFSHMVFSPYIYLVGAGFSVKTT